MAGKQTLGGRQKTSGVWEYVKYDRGKMSANALSSYPITLTLFGYIFSHSYDCYA